jgi:RNA polymerase sigma factor (sigma-70 family)
VPDAPTPDLEPEAVLLRSQEQEFPRAAFADLAPSHQEILRLRFVDELDYDAVAARLQTTEHAARQRVYRAMQALRAIAQRMTLGFDSSA